MSNSHSTSGPGNDHRPSPVVAREILIPFILITFCFALWGFANDITNPLVKAFGTIFNQSVFISAFVQFAFYGGYCFMAIPAAILIKRYTYKFGILVGLLLYAAGGIAFIPASWVGLFWPFCAAFFVMTCGLSFLETSANPYILSMGAEETATQRLNFAQSFNPLGSITGAWVAKRFILERLDKLSATDRAGAADRTIQRGQNGRSGGRSRALCGDWIRHRHRLCLDLDVAHAAEQG